MEKQLSIFDPPPMSDLISKLSSLPLHEQPEYRYREDPKACNLVELISVIIGDQYQIEDAEKLLRQFGSIQDIDHASVNELENILGMNQNKALRLKAALTIGKRMLAAETDHKQQICGYRDVAHILCPVLANQVQEYVYVLLLYTRQCLLKMEEVYHGSANLVNVRLAEILMPAIKINATGLILAHNHPSGNETPSSDDLSLTKELVSAGRIMSINILDHIVFGSANRVKSIKDGYPEVFN